MNFSWLDNEMINIEHINKREFVEAIMNYFIKVNEKLIQQLNFEIDKCPTLHEDMVKFWNKRIKGDNFN